MPKYKHNDYYGYINKIQEQAISNPQWFWSDDPKASEARQWLYDNDAEEIVDNIYNNTPEDIQKSINHQKLSIPSDLKRTVNKINDGRNEFAEKAFTVGSAVASVPSLAVGLVSAPVMTTVGLLSGIGGSVAGDYIGKQFNKNYIVDDIPVASTHANIGALIGGALIGGSLAGLVGGVGRSKLDHKVQKPKWMLDLADDLTWNTNKWNDWRNERFKNYDTDVSYAQYVKDGVFNESLGDEFGRKYLDNNAEFNLNKDQVSDLLYGYTVPGAKYFNADGTPKEVIPNKLTPIARKLGLPEYTYGQPITDDIVRQVNETLTKQQNHRLFRKLDSRFHLRDKLPLVRSQKGREAVVKQAREAQKGIDFVTKGLAARHSINDRYIGFKNNENFYQKPKLTLDYMDLISSYNDQSTNTAHIGISPHKHFVFSEGTLMKTADVAAHEAGHSKVMFNTRGTLHNFIPDFQNMTDNEKNIILKDLYKDSPYYHMDYSNVPKRHRDLLSVTKKVKDHDFELAEGYSDLWGTRFNMRNINDAGINPNKKYTYLDLIRYKLTLQGIGDRFIQQRGGWWKGWRQQLDALNEVYKNGGKI